jgi:hypothetical protein
MFLVRPEIGRLPVAEDHVIPVTDSRHCRQRLASSASKAIGNDPPGLLLSPGKAVTRNGMPIL